MADDAIISVRDLTKRFGGVVAVDNVSFEVPEGVILGIIGPNGAGKTTLFHTITGLHTRDEGEILLRDREIHDLTTAERALAGIGMTFQIPQVFEGMTVADNLRVAAKNQSGESLHKLFTDPSQVADDEEQIEERADEILEFLELDHLADDYAKGISGGQSKLLELGRVMMGEPEVILLDEPVAGVNPTLTNELLARINELNNEGITFLVIEHDMEVIMDICDLILVMHNGDVLKIGTPEEVQQDPQVIEAYLGGEV